jgi:pyridoxamine-phosphate oxidase
VFYTNYESRKSQELAENPNACLVFYWDPLHKTVRIEGEVEKVSEEESTKYFHTRPRISQLGAWASPKQSSEIGSREELDKLFDEMTLKFEGVEEIPKPDYWGGWRVRPNYYEFW